MPRSPTSAAAAPITASARRSKPLPQLDGVRSMNRGQTRAHRLDRREFLRRSGAVAGSVVLLQIAIPLGACASASSSSDAPPATVASNAFRSEEHTSELQSLMRNSYAVFCLKKKNKKEN